MSSKEEHMLEALELAKRGSLTASPNPLVGCVITYENKVIGRGWHERSGEREIPSRLVGEAVMQNLRKIDEVAFIRFASVYRRFEDITEFSEEVEKLTSD